MIQRTIQTTLQPSSQKRALAHLSKLPVAAGSIATHLNMMGGESGTMLIPWVYQNEMLFRLSVHLSMPHGARSTPPALLEYGGGSGNMGTTKLYFDLDPIFPYVAGFDDVYPIVVACMRVLACEFYPSMQDDDLREFLRCIVLVSPPKRMNAPAASSAPNPAHTANPSPLPAPSEDDDTYSDREQDDTPATTDTADSLQTPAPSHAESPMYKVGVHICFENLVGHNLLFAHVRMALVRMLTSLLGERTAPLNPWHAVIDAPGSLRMAYSHKIATCPDCARSKKTRADDASQCQCRGTGRINEGRPCLPAMVLHGPASRASLMEECELIRDMTDMERAVGLRAPHCNRLALTLQLPHHPFCWLCGVAPADTTIIRQHATTARLRMLEQTLNLLKEADGVEREQETPLPLTQLETLQLTRWVMAHLVQAAMDHDAFLATLVNPYFTLTISSIRPALDCRPTPGFVIPPQHAELVEYARHRAFHTLKHEGAPAMLNAYRSPAQMIAMMRAKELYMQRVDPEATGSLHESVVNNILARAVRSSPQWSAIELSAHVLRSQALLQYIRSSLPAEYACYKEANLRTVVMEHCPEYLTKVTSATKMYRVDLICRFCKIQNRTHKSNHVVLLFLNTGVMTQVCYSTPERSAGDMKVASSAQSLHVPCANSCCTVDGVRIRFNYCGPLVAYAHAMLQVLFVFGNGTSCSLQARDSMVRMVRARSEKAEGDGMAGVVPLSLELSAAPASAPTSAPTIAPTIAPTSAPAITPLPVKMQNAALMRAKRMIDATRS
jgi:hypothetical protein